jgi:hypothetical protein
MLIHACGPSAFCAILEKTPRPGPEPSIERIGHLIALAAHSVKLLSRTGAKLEDVSAWVEEAFPEPASMVTFVKNIPVDVLGIILLGIQCEIHLRWIAQVANRIDAIFRVMIMKFHAIELLGQLYTLLASARLSG